MKPNKLIFLLGKDTLNGDVEAVLRIFEIERRPQVTIDESDADGPVIEVQDWVINSHAGIEFGFEDEASWLGFDRFEYGAGPMLLTQIYLYGEHEGVNPYQGQLPFNLMMGDGRVTVRKKLSQFESTRRSYVRDTWELPDCRMTVSYVDNGERIGFIYLTYTPESSKSLGVVQSMPDIEEIIEALGREEDNLLVRKLFSPFGLYRRLTDNDQEYPDYCRENFGFELRFRKHKFSKEKPAFDGLSHLVFYREREMGASGWLGRLPHNIAFVDSPEVLIQKMELPPDKITDELFVGYALWHFANYSVRVKYSTMDNFLLSIDLLAPGIWDAYSA